MIPFCRQAAKMFAMLSSLIFFAVTAKAMGSNGVQKKTFPPTSLKILTYNILVTDNPLQTGPWRVRQSMIADLIRTGEYDIVSVQEALPEMLEDLSALLPQYTYAGVGRDDGGRKGEFAAIFYRKDRVELLESRTFWLSSTPDIPGLGWDARCPRIVTWGRFKDLKTGSPFYVFNTHFDHLGRESQRNSALLLSAEAKRIAQGLPTVVMGDFNVPESSEAYQLFKSHSGLSDAITLTKHEGPRWTHSFYGVYKHKIDYVFVSPAVKVLQHAVIPENPFSLYQRSDHLPISMVAEIQEP